MLDETAKGVFTIAATPFLPDGALDIESVDRVVDFYAERGATGLTILGMMGEAGKLTSTESVEIIKRVFRTKDASKRERESLSVIRPS